MSLNQMIDGWSNLLKSKFGELDPRLLKLSQHRISICGNCELFKNYMCSRNSTTMHVKTGEMVNGCGCVLAAKTLCEGCQCPAGKW